MTDVAVKDAGLRAEQARAGLGPHRSDPGLECYRAELTSYCYRRLRSTSDAEDAAQETLVRAWRAIDQFEGRAKLRSWLYRIAANICVDMARARQRRADLTVLATAARAQLAASPSARLETATSHWNRIGQTTPEPADSDPADKIVERDIVRLAFAAMNRRLPPRQRAVLVLREVLCWRADEVAELLDMTVAAVNSALQRARAGLAAGAPTLADLPDAEGEGQPGRCAQAFASYDVATLVSLLDPHR